jgi:hypothetical protein
VCDVFYGFYDLYTSSPVRHTCFFQPGTRLSKEFAEENGFDLRVLTGGITHDDYRSLYSQWHKKIGSAAIGCLESAEYMHTRAALIVLSRIVSVFPTQPKIGERILKTLAPLQSEDNERPDIRATAQGYCSQLTKARDEGMWKEENIAVTRARQEREKMKAEEKKKKLAERHEEMKKETETISRQLQDDGRDAWRQDRRDGSYERGRPWSTDPRHSRVCPTVHISDVQLQLQFTACRSKIFQLVTIVVFCSQFLIPLHRHSRQKTEQKNRGSLTAALRNRDDRGQTAKDGIAKGVAGRQGIIRGRAVSPLEVKGESEADLQNLAKTLNARLRKNEFVATSVGHHHLVGLALTSSRIVAVGELEAPAVLNEEGLGRVAISENFVFLSLDKLFCWILHPLAGLERAL